MRGGHSSHRLRLIHRHSHGVVTAPRVQRARQRTQIPHHQTARVVALVALFPQGSLDDPLQFFRHLADLGERRRIAKEDGADDVGRGGALERRLPGEHFVEKDAEREQVGAPVDVAPTRLLRGHVVERAHDDAVSRLHELRRGVIARRKALPPHELRQTEVQDLDIAIGANHHVLGLQVAMDDACVVRGRDRLRNLHGNRDRLPGVEAAAIEDRTQRDAVDELGREELHAAVVADVVDREDVGMIEGRNRARLALEAAEPFLVAHGARREHFQCEPAAQPNVLGQIDLRHAARSERREDAVVRQHIAAGECPACALGGRWHDPVL